ncbi:FHA domain-containing protein [Leifsonia poae]|uniref:FHA domain-containing protein n=1 Tax=Leifsonia poae TaxID=110933 RepID=UPI001CBC8974|nr:FHA domain-containing protein [Leifsonia poae]
MTPGFTRYAPSGARSRWLFVAGRRFVAVVESSVSEGIVETLWWLADSELATIESVVGAFPLTGADAVRSFAVAELAEPNATNEVLVTAVVRGSAAVDVFSVGGSRRFAAGGVQPWVLAEFRSVTGLVLGGDDLPTGPVARASVGSLPLGSGVVDGELLAWSLTPLQRIAAAPAVEAAPTDDEADLGEETIIRARRGGSLFAHPEPLAPPEIPRTPPGRMPGAVDIEPSADTSASTIRSAPDDGFPSTQPVLLPPAPVPARYAILMGSGDRFALDEPILIGRRPSPQRIGSGPEPRLVAVSSPDQEVSSTHVRIEQAGDAVVVTDLRSTNGTVVAADGQRQRLRPGQSLVVLPGALIEIGDGNIIEITAVSGEM